MSALDHSQNSPPFRRLMTILGFPSGSVTYLPAMPSRERARKQLVSLARGVADRGNRDSEARAANECASGFSVAPGQSCQVGLNRQALDRALGRHDAASLPPENVAPGDYQQWWVAGYNRLRSARQADWPSSWSHSAAKQTGRAFHASQDVVGQVGMGTRSRCSVCLARSAGLQQLWPSSESVAHAPEPRRA